MPSSKGECAAVGAPMVRTSCGRSFCWFAGGLYSMHLWLPHRRAPRLGTTPLGSPPVPDLLQPLKVYVPLRDMNGDGIVEFAVRKDDGSRTAFTFVAEPR